jgi:hypothetical protein
VNDNLRLSALSFGLYNLLFTIHSTLLRTGLLLTIGPASAGMTSIEHQESSIQDRETLLIDYFRRPLLSKPERSDNFACD